VAKSNTFSTNGAVLEREQDIENARRHKFFQNLRRCWQPGLVGLAKWQVTQPCYLPSVVAGNHFGSSTVSTTIIQIVRQQKISIFIQVWLLFFSRRPERYYGVDKEIKQSRNMPGR
jgi:hypothetical protein